MLDKIISNAKSILCNEIPFQMSSRPKRFFRASRAKLGTSLLLSTLKFGNSFLLWPEILLLWRLEPAMPRSGFDRNGTERNAPYPQVE
jgi:hypothetical protein